jgi:hypothetical protein
MRPADGRREADVTRGGARRRAETGVGHQSMWGGRLAGGPAAIMRRINASIDFDKRLYAEDIAGSRGALRDAGRQQRIIARKMAPRSPAV